MCVLNWFLVNYNLSRADPVIKDIDTETVYCTSLLYTCTNVDIFINNPWSTCRMLEKIGCLDHSVIILVANDSMSCFWFYLIGLVCVHISVKPQKKKKTFSQSCLVVVHFLAVSVHWPNQKDWAFALIWINNTNRATTTICPNWTKLIPFTLSKTP